MFPMVSDIVSDSKKEVRGWNSKAILLPLTSYHLFLIYLFEVTSFSYCWMAAMYSSPTGTLFFRLK